MIAFLFSPVGRLAGAAVLIALAIGWGAMERAGRVAAAARADAASAALAGAEARIRNMETRHEADDAAARERDPVERLRNWSRD